MSQVIELDEKEIKDILKCVSLPIIHILWEEDEVKRLKELSEFFKQLVQEKNNDMESISNITKHERKAILSIANCSR